MVKFKKVLGYIILSGVLIALYASECYEAIYFRKNGVEHPQETLVSICILIAFTVFIIFMALTSRKKEENPHRDFSWKYYILPFIYLNFQNYVFDKGQRIAENARITPTAVNIDKAVADIITLYAIAIVVITVGLVVIEFIGRKSKSSPQLTAQKIGKERN